MILSFELSMPSNNSWNGRWSGDSKLYAKVLNIGRTQKAEKKGREILENAPYYYNFGDGWAASVSVKAVDAKEAGQIRRKSQGFCGYDWMVRSIQDAGKIEAKLP